MPVKIVPVFYINIKLQNHDLKNTGLTLRNLFTVLSFRFLFFDLTIKSPLTKKIFKHLKTYKYFKGKIFSSLKRIN